VLKKRNTPSGFVSWERSGDISDQWGRGRNLGRGMQRGTSYGKERVVEKCKKRD